MRVRLKSWESSFFNHALYDINYLIVASVYEDLNTNKFMYYVFSHENRIHNFASGSMDTLEAAMFLCEVLSIQAGWKFK
jgi:hypothetical protein